MEFTELIGARHSVRIFQNQPVDHGKLRALLASATQAPSAGGRQAYRIHVVRDEVTRRALAAAAQGQEFVASAPVVLVFCADLAVSDGTTKGSEQRYSIQDAIIAMTYAQLAATDLGLATCWVGGIDEAAILRCLKLPAAQRPIGILPLGYADEDPQPAPRRPLAELVVGLDD
ncbi:MAG: nitroreductase family protein [Limisphaerales bacterium]